VAFGQYGGGAFHEAALAMSPDGGACVQHGSTILLKWLLEKSHFRIIDGAIHQPPVGPTLGCSAAPAVVPLAALQGLDTAQRVIYTGTYYVRLTMIQLYLSVIGERGLGLRTWRGKGLSGRMFFYWTSYFLEGPNGS
jgi:hypothetical protein